MPDIVEDLQPNLLENMIRQRKLMSSFTGGLPSPMPESPQTPSNPDLTVHHLVGTMPQDQAPATPQTTPEQAPPVPKIGPINPNSENPAESAYKQALMNEPMKADYHPSTKRKVLSALAGGAEGFFGGAKAGMQLHESLRNGPYDQEHENWAQFAGNREKLADEEIAGTATAGKAKLTQAQIAEQEALANLHNHDAKTYHPVNQTQLHEDNQSRLKTDTREVEMNDGTIKHVIQKNGLFYDPETNAKISRDAFGDISDEGKSLKQTRAERIPGNLGASIKAKKIMAAGVGGKTDDGIKVDQSTFEAAKQFDEALSAGKEPAGAFARIIKDRNAERVASGQPKMTSQEEETLQVKLLSVEKPLQQMLVNPADNSTFRAVPNMKLPNGAQTPQQVGASSAKNAQEVKDLKADQEFVNDYLSNQSHTGPGDEALLERFFNVTKPSTGFRMNQAQIALLTRLRSFSSSVKAFMAHQTGGTLFDDKQRREIVDTINQITNSKIGGGDQLPGGISLQDIDAEIARRKGGK